MSDREVVYAVRGPKNIYEMTGYEFGEMLKVTDICLVPAGSVETHGPHAPLGTDGILATEIARRLAARLADDGMPVFIAPTIPFGTTPYLAELPGTISISSDLLKGLIKEICFGLVHHGIKRFVFILGHTGNQATMQVAAEEVTQGCGADVVYLNWVLPLHEAATSQGLLHEGGVMAHGGESETSRVLAAHPELVDLSKAVKHFRPRKAAAPIEFGKSAYMGGGVDRQIKSFKTLMPAGSSGDPALATAETGNKLYDIAVDWCARVVQREYGPD